MKKAHLQRALPRRHHPSEARRPPKDQFLEPAARRRSLNFLGHPKFTTNLHTHGFHVTPGDNPDAAPFTPGSHGDNMLVVWHIM
ncbi:MAG: hypothetical protein Kow00129_16200 [Thermoleophilia bacterium]